MLLIIFLFLGILVMFYLCIFQEKKENFSPPVCRKTKDCTTCISSNPSCNWNESKKDCSSYVGDGYTGVCPIEPSPPNGDLKITYHVRKNKKKKQKRKN